MTLSAPRRWTILDDEEAARRIEQARRAIVSHNVVSRTITDRARSPIDELLTCGHVHQGVPGQRHRTILCRPCTDEARLRRLSRILKDDPRHYLMTDGRIGPVPDAHPGFLSTCAICRIGR